MHWSAAYSGIPFRDGGRTRRECDCWGLVRLVYQEQLSIALPSYGEISAMDLLQVAAAIGGGHNGEQWIPIEVSELRAFDVAVMRGWGVRDTCHVGIMIDERQVLHVEQGIDAVIVPLDHYTVRRRLVAFRRHVELK